eukprot:5637167-Amphidinium_carterae.1
MDLVTPTGNRQYSLLVRGQDVPVSRTESTWEQPVVEPSFTLTLHLGPRSGPTDNQFCGTCLTEGGESFCTRSSRTRTHTARLSGLSRPDHWQM